MKFGDAASYAHLIGRLVIKKSRKPFKSGVLVNTVKGIVPHPHIDEMAFTFVEDDSVVAAHICHEYLGPPMVSVANAKRSGGGIVDTATSPARPL